MDAFVDVEMALQPISVPAPGIGGQPCRAPKSTSKSRKLRWSTWRSPSLRRRLGICRPDLRAIKRLRGKCSDRYSFAAPTALTAKRALRAIRPFAPHVARSLLLVFLLSQVFFAYAEVDEMDFGTDMDAAFAAVAFVAGVLFTQIQNTHYPLKALCAYFVYRCVNSYHFGPAALQLTHGLSVAVFQLAGTCRHSRSAVKKAEATSQTAGTVLTTKDFVYALARFAIATVLVDITLGVSTCLSLLVIPIALVFAVGYCSRRATMGLLLAMPIVACFCSASETSMGGSGLHILPEIAASLLMLCGGCGALTVDEMSAGQDGLVY